MKFALKIFGKFLGILVLAGPLFIAASRLKAAPELFYVGIAIVCVVTQIFLFKSIVSDLRGEDT